MLLPLPGILKQYRKSQSWLQAWWNGSLFTLTQTIQNAGIRLPFRVSHYSTNQESDIFWCMISGPNQRCMWSWIVQELWLSKRDSVYTVLCILKISHKTHRGWCLLRKEGLGLSMSFLIFELWKAVFASLTASRFYDICKCREEAICMKAYYFLYCICSFVRSRWIVSITCARKCCRHRVIRRC